MMKKLFCMWMIVCALGLCCCSGDRKNTELRAIEAEDRIEQDRMEQDRAAQSNMETDGGTAAGGERTGHAEAGGAQPEQNALPLSRYAVSDVEAAVRCAGEEIYKLNFSAGGKYAYLCGSRIEPPVGGSLADATYFIGVTDAPTEGQEECRIRELFVEMPDGMRVLRMAADREGKCYLLWVSKAEKNVDGQVMEAFTYEKCRIMVLDAEGNVLKNMDVSDIFAEGHGLLYCFNVDNEGNYYMENGSEIIRLSMDGTFLSRIRCDGRVESIGCGRSGAVYCVCRGEDKAEWLCRIEEDDSVKRLAELPPADSLYPRIGAGTDTELIVYHRDGGIYAVDARDGETGKDSDDGTEGAVSGVGNVEVELRVRESEMPVSGQEIGGDGILGDGRVCLYAQDGTEAVFYYIPVGR